MRVHYRLMQLINTVSAGTPSYNYGYLYMEMLYLEYHYMIAMHYTRTCTIIIIIATMLSRACVGIL